jgi:hypothetical protein
MQILLKVLEAILIDLLTMNIQGLLSHSTTVADLAFAIAIYLWMSRLTKNK